MRGYPKDSDSDDLEEVMSPMILQWALRAPDPDPHGGGRRQGHPRPRRPDAGRPEPRRSPADRVGDRGGFLQKFLLSYYLRHLQKEFQLNVCLVHKVYV